MFDSEDTKAFTYLGIQLIQKDGFRLTINQNNYTDCISEIKLYHTHVKNVGHTSEFIFDELETHIIIKKTVELGQ